MNVPVEVRNRETRRNELCYQIAPHEELTQDPAFEIQIMRGNAFGHSTVPVDSVALLDVVCASIQRWRAASGIRTDEPTLTLGNSPLASST
jgi:hypothetical protein